jgi:HEAT repeat protein
LLLTLDDDVTSVRDAVEAALGQVVRGVDPAAAADELIVALEHGSATVRAAAAGMLGELGQTEALVPLLLQLDDDDAGVREASERAVPALIAALSRREAATILVEAIDHDSTAIRVTAARALGDLGQRIGVPPLLGLHADPDAQVREEAAGALATLIDALPAGGVVHELYDHLGDNRAEVADAADAALRTLLSTLGPEQAVEAIQAVDSSDAWLAVALDVNEAELATRTRELGIQLEPLEDIRRAAAPAADGSAVSGTRPYEASDGFHPAIVLGSAPWSQTELWAPTALRFLELVVTIDDIDWRVIEVCAYDGPDITRYQGRQTVRVRSAADGRQIAERTFEGTNPRACRQQEPWSLVELFGDAPDVGAAATWLGSIINPPD